ncbi:MAG TPA: hypothetical protein PKY82_32770 [Pyrinomonadaceae bacterium]|nr:hypothetical protein [Pyrinomonadaceae bacterium]
MAINSNLLRRPNDRNLYLAAGVLFPLLVFIGYFKTYYLSKFFEVPPIANSLVHLHAIVMSVWVLYFTAQVALIRTKNIKLHMTMGMAGIALAAIVVIVGLATAYDSHVVRHTAPPGLNPYSFLVIPLGDMALFILFFAGAIYYRKKPFEHKSLMLMTAINFAAPAIARIPVVSPEYFLLWAFGVPCLIAVTCLIGLSIRHRKINKVLALAVLLFVVLQPLRISIGLSDWWVQLMTRIFG